MDKQTKVRVVSEVTELAEQSKAVVLAGFTGLTVEAETKLRKSVREAEGTYRVIRNTLAHRAMADEQWAELRNQFQGNNAFAFTNTDVIALMKTLVDFAKENEGLTIKGGFFEGKPLSADDVKTLANMPPREQLLGMLANVLQSPIQRLHTVLTGTTRKFAQVCKALADKKEAGEL